MKRYHTHSVPTRRSSDLNPMEDALIIEGNESPYVNILVARPDNQEEEAIQILMKHLKSDKVKEFIEEEYDGAVRSEEHTSELQSRGHLVCRLLPEKIM